MSKLFGASGRMDGVERRGIALAAVLYFLILAALTSIAVVFGARASSRRTSDRRTDAILNAAADAMVYGALAQWNGPERLSQPIGVTLVMHPAAVNGAEGTLWLTRVGLRVFSLIAEVHPREGGPSRRVTLVVRVPLPPLAIASALVSAVDVSIGDGVRIVGTDTGMCIDSAAAAITIAPNAVVLTDSLLAPGQRPSVRVDSIAGDSSAYLRIADWWWNALVRNPDIRLDADARIFPTPHTSDGTCTNESNNWGMPTDATSPCHARAPLVYAPGDLTIEGGLGQGVLLVDGRLSIIGSFTFSGQIVARRGIETHADAISITGVMRAWRATSDSTRSHATRSDVVLTHGTTLRFSRCDAQHGMASWLEPRAVHRHAWTELF